jgi:hypothetical protein
MTAPGPAAEAAAPTAGAIPTVVPASTRSVRWLIVGMVVLLVVAPFVAYPITS